MDNWIYCGDGKNMPEEHDTLFAKLKQKDNEKYKDAICKKSDDVNVTVEFDDGKRKVITLHTANGKWITDLFIDYNVIAWRPLPEPYNL